MGLGFLVTEMSQEFVLSAYVRIWVVLFETEKKKRGKLKAV